MRFEKLNLSQKSGAMTSWLQWLTSTTLCIWLSNLYSRNHKKYCLETLCSGRSRLISSFEQTALRQTGFVIVRVIKHLTIHQTDRQTSWHGVIMCPGSVWVKEKSIVNDHFTFRFWLKPLKSHLKTHQWGSNDCFMLGLVRGHAGGVNGHEGKSGWPPLSVLYSGH